MTTPIDPKFVKRTRRVRCTMCLRPKEIKQGDVCHDCHERISSD